MTCFEPSRPCQLQQICVILLFVMVGFCCEAFSIVRTTTTESAALNVALRGPATAFPFGNYYSLQQPLLLQMKKHRRNLFRLYNTGGWGIGPQREMTPEEFVNGRKGSVERSGASQFFEGYQLRDRGEFMRQVARDKEALQLDAIAELRNVAKIAGLKVKDPTDRLNKFDPAFIDDTDEKDDLDVSVRWDEDEVDDDNKRDVKDTDSITRMDEDTGALGVW